MKKIKINENINKRIDSYLISVTEFSRSKIQKLIEEEFIKVNNKAVKNNYLIKINDEITIEEPSIEINFNQKADIPLDIIYEDEDIIVINKQNGLVVHPTMVNDKNTLVNALLNHSSNLSDINGEFRPGIVHRIDAYTTGLIIVAKNNKAHETLAKDFEEHKIDKQYLALVSGVINNDTGTIDAPIGRDTNDRKKMAVNEKGKDAITHFTVLKRFSNATLLKVKLETGRTHQIRVHMAYIGHPIVNDPSYSKKNIIDNTGQALHASEITFTHPTTKQTMHFTVPLPECFENIMKKIEGDIDVSNN